jgi:hypothetical protein
MADSSIAITAGVGTPVDTFTQASGDHRQAMVIGDSVGVQVASVFPGGELRVQPEALQLFYDPYDAALDTVNRWNAPVSGNSAVAASVTAGTLSLATGTVASGYSVLTSQPTFRSSTPGWIRFAYNINLPDGAAPTANSFRYWGAAVPQAVPTTANPIQNGCGFEVATTGKMYAVVYNNATRTAVADLSSSGTNVQPLDANPHNYQVFYRPTNIYYFIDSVLVATATLAQSALAVDAMPHCYMAVGFSTPPSPSAVLNSNAVSTSDTAAGNVTISDPQFNWRRQSVNASGQAAVLSTQQALTKGTQGATGVSVQELKDAGRVNIMWTLEFAPAAVAEALMTMTESRDGAAVTTYTTKVVTSGKRLRITSLSMVVENTLGVNPKRAKLRMKFNTAGPVTTASPLQGTWAASVATAVNTIGTSLLEDFPDGIEYLGDGTKQIGFTLEFPDWVTVAQTGKVYVTVFAYEY